MLATANWALIVLIKEVATIKPQKPLTPQQARIKQLQSTATQAKKRVKQERIQQQQAKLNLQQAELNKS